MKRVCSIVDNILGQTQGFPRPNTIIRCIFVGDVEALLGTELGQSGQVPRACCILFSSMQTSLFLIQSQTNNTFFVKGAPMLMNRAVLKIMNLRLEVRKTRTCDWNVLMFHCFT